MELKHLIDDSATDKNTTHSYLDLYEELLHKKRSTARHVLEVGIGDFKEKNGGSIKLWRDYFEHAIIHGLDILPKHRIMDELLHDDRVKLYVEINAYDESFFYNTIFSQNIKFDFLLDDGPHTLESMKLFIKLYSTVMADDGILIIEDVQSIDWIPSLSEIVPEHLKKFIKTYDLRTHKGRYDDIVFTIDKSR